MTSIARAQLQCRCIDAGDDLVALTELLHAAYSRHATRGLRYWATHQSVEDTAKRLAEGTGFVGMLEGTIVATMTLRPSDPESSVEIFRDPLTWSFGQFAVHPHAQGQGHGKRLHDFVLDYACARGAARMALDTAQPATELIAMYRAWGYVESGTCDWRPHTNYPSVVMVKVLHDRMRLASDARCAEGSS